MKYYISLVIAFLVSCQSLFAQEYRIEMDQCFPWCIVAYDSLKRSPEERVSMIKELGFNKYVYDWRDHHLPQMAEELMLCQKYNIEVSGIWLWMNAKRDKIGKFSPGNEKMLQILGDTGIETTIWLSFNGNFFKGLNDKEALMKAIDLIKFVHDSVRELNCTIALYNHSGWFGNPYNLIKVVKKIPDLQVGIVLNFHHCKEYIKEFKHLAVNISPYLHAVNLNGMSEDSPKILAVGKGKYESDMIMDLFENRYTGPWGILGHIAEKDVRKVLDQNISGLKQMGFMH